MSGGRTPARTPFAILGVLSFEPSSGVEIQRWLRERIGNFWHESSGQLYPTLARLRDEGAVHTVETEPGPEPGRPSKVYEITDRGRERLREWLREPVVETPRRNELLLKLFFSLHEPDIVPELLAESRREQRANLARYAAIEEELDELAKTRPAEAARFRATVRYGTAVAQAVLAWTDEAERLLRRED